MLWIKQWKTKRYIQRLKDIYLLSKWKDFQLERKPEGIDGCTIFYWKSTLPKTDIAATQKGRSLWSHLKRSFTFRFGKQKIDASGHNDCETNIKQFLL